MLFKALAALPWGAGISLFSGIAHIGVDDVRSDLTDARSHLQSSRDILTNGIICRVFQMYDRKVQPQQPPVPP